MAVRRIEQVNNERGMALIAALMMSTMLLGLGMAVVMSVTIDTGISRSQRVGEQAFFAADAGVAIARSALATALQEEVQKIQSGEADYGDNGFTRIDDPEEAGEFPDVQVIPAPTPTNWDNHPFYINVRQRAEQLAAVEKRDERLRDLNGASFAVDFRPVSGSVNLVTTAGDATRAVEAVVLRYSIDVTGRTEAGGRARVTESGLMSMNITLSNSGVPGTGRDFSFSGFGAFFDNGDSISNSALSAGTFTGPVHTNTHLAFFSNRNVVFRNVVSQVDSYIRYDSTDFGQGRRNIPGGDIKGIDISGEGYKQTDQVPLPDNNFSQEYAVINGTGIIDKRADGSPVDPPAVMPVDNKGNPLPIFNTLGRVTPEALSANLRNESRNKPSVSGGTIGNGVYVPSGDGSTITGAGIYVQGDATDVQLIASGTDQIYVISQKQGNSTTTTTITVSPSKNQTTIQTGSRAATYSGIPTDRSNPDSPRQGVSLFVNGSINSLRGGVSGSNRRPALAPGTRLTISAQRHITITGDIKYADPVLNSDGTPVSNISAVENVLGIYTNDGNVNLAPNANFVSGTGLSLEINAAIVAFNRNGINDSGRIEGSIVYTGGNSPGSADRWKLVGSRVQSKINNIGYSNRDIFFDVRFSGGKFAPPFFPGTKYDLGKESVAGEVTISKMDSPTPTGISWFRRDK
jgi:hypothetical protein